MLELNLTATPVGLDAVSAGYSCPCGCTPATTYSRGSAVATEGCCCGNSFAVGPEAASHVHAPDGYNLETDSIVAPWGERVPVAWAIGPSTHGHPADEAAGHQHEAGEHHHAAAKADSAIDPVCGMTVDREAAITKGLHIRHGEVDYYFCGRGCKLEFEDDPNRYLDPSYVPSM